MSSRDYRSRFRGKVGNPQSNPLSGAIADLYTALSHRRIIAKGSTREKLDALIMSIGNITFGGSGKTPHVEFFAKHLTDRKFKVGIASGGFGGTESKDGVLVFDGSKMCAGFLRAGDEATLLSLSVLEYGIPVYAHRNRITAAKELIAKFNCNAVLLDDAFHFVSVQKDFDIVLIDSLNPLGGGKLPSRGMMREPLTSVKRADAVILTHADQAGNEEVEKIDDLINKSGFSGPIFKSSYKPSTVKLTNHEETNLDSVKSLKLIPMSGIGNPISFEKYLSEMGIDYRNPIRFNDHQVYSVSEIELINQAIKTDSSDGIITTEKDWVRLERLFGKIEGNVYVLHSEIVIDDSCLKWIDSKI